MIHVPGWCKLQAPARTENVTLLSVQLNSKNIEVCGRKLVTKKVNSSWLIISWFAGKTKHLATCQAKHVTVGQCSFEVGGAERCFEGSSKSRLRCKTAWRSNHDLSQCNTCLKPATWLSREIGSGKFYAWPGKVPLCAVGFLCRTPTGTLKSEGRLLQSQPQEVMSWWTRGAINWSSISSVI